MPVLNSFAPNFNGCHPRTSYLLKVMLQLSVLAALSVQRPQWFSGCVPGPWGAGCLIHVPGHLAPPTAASAVWSRHVLTVQLGSDAWMCPGLGSSEKICSPCFRGSGSVSSVKSVAFS